MFCYTLVYRMILFLLSLSIISAERCAGEVSCSPHFLRVHFCRLYHPSVHRLGGERSAKIFVRSKIFGRAKQNFDGRVKNLQVLVVDEAHRLKNNQSKVGLPHTFTASHPHTFTPSHPHTLHTFTPSHPHTLAVFQSSEYVLSEIQVATDRHATSEQP